MMGQLADTEKALKAYAESDPDAFAELQAKVRLIICIHFYVE